MSHPLPRKQQYTTDKRHQRKVKSSNTLFGNLMFPTHDLSVQATGRVIGYNYSAPLARGWVNREEFVHYTSKLMEDHRPECQKGKVIADQKLEYKICQDPYLGKRYDAIQYITDKERQYLEETDRPSSSSIFGWNVPEWVVSIVEPILAQFPQGQIPLSPIVYRYNPYKIMDDIKHEMVIKTQNDTEQYNSGWFNIGYENRKELQGLKKLEGIEGRAERNSHLCYTNFMALQGPGENGLQWWMYEKLWRIIERKDFMHIVHNKKIKTKFDLVTDIVQSGLARFGEVPTTTENHTFIKLLMSQTEKNLYVRVDTTDFQNFYALVSKMVNKTVTNIHDQNKNLTYDELTNILYSENSEDEDLAKKNNDMKKDIATVYDEVFGGWFFLTEEKKEMMRLMTMQVSLAMTVNHKVENGYTRLTQENKRIAILFEQKLAQLVYLACLGDNGIGANSILEPFGKSLHAGNRDTSIQDMKRITTKAYDMFYKMVSAFTDPRVAPFMTLKEKERWICQFFPCKMIPAGSAHQTLAQVGRERQLTGHVPGHRTATPNSMLPTAHMPVTNRRILTSPDVHGPWHTPGSLASDISNMTSNNASTSMDHDVCLNECTPGPLPPAESNMTLASANYQDVYGNGCTLESGVTFINATRPIAQTAHLEYWKNKVPAWQESFVIVSDPLQKVAVRTDLESLEGNWDLLERDTNTREVEAIGDSHVPGTTNADNPLGTEGTNALFKVSQQSGDLPDTVPHLLTCPENLKSLKKLEAAGEAQDEPTQRGIDLWNSLQNMVYKLQDYLSGILSLLDIQALARFIFKEFVIPFSLFLLKALGIHLSPYAYKGIKHVLRQSKNHSETLQIEFSPIQELEQYARRNNMTNEQMQAYGENVMEKVCRQVEISTITQIIETAIDQIVIETSDKQMELERKREQLLSILRNTQRDAYKMFQ